MKNYEADIVIVGGGASGLAAADFAARMGEHVILVEKMGVTGGCANMAAGVFAVESHIQKEAQETLTTETMFRILMNFTHYSADAGLTKSFLERSAEIIDWLEELGVRFSGVYKYNPLGERVWHLVAMPGTNAPADRAAAVIVKAMSEDAEHHGVQVLFNTEVTEIIMEDGYACGVRAAGTGGKCEIRADAVIIATNGFQQDSPLGAELLGKRWLGDVVCGGHSIPGLTGDGIRILRQAGAAMTDISMTCNTAINGVSKKHETIESVMSQFDLVVNKSGLRVMNEVYTQDPECMCRQILRSEGHKLFTILDSRTLEEYRNKGLSWMNPIHTAKSLKAWDGEIAAYEEEQSIFEEEDEEFAEFFEEISMTPGDFWVCGSVEEISEKTGIDPNGLRKTLEQYNADAGRQDSRFFKPAKYMKPVAEPPFYVAAHTISEVSSRGGIKTDGAMRCCTEEHIVIPGLYCIGTDANSLMGDALSFHRVFGASLTFAMVSAKLAAEDIQRYFAESFQTE